MGEAKPINQWMRSLLMALCGVLDSYEYAKGSGDDESAAILLAVATGLVSEPWHPFMHALSGWTDEVERWRSIAGSTDAPSVPRQTVDEWTGMYLDAADRDQGAREYGEKHRWVRRREDAKED